MSYTIVAIPAKDDHVWEVSSEKVPHMTLLALGDTLANESRVIDFLGHVAETSLCRFGLSVKRRDVLGPEKADVLFFESYGVKRLVDVRANLLKNKDVFMSYNSTMQYPVWTPHLTMGYPATPAKPDKRDYPISYVNFDRVALWTGDYEGPEFELNDQYGLLSDQSALAYMSTEEALAHFGIKGMRWGNHNATPIPAGITRGQNSYNAQQHGRRGAERIRARVAAGSDLKTAREAEHIRNKKQTKAVAYGALAAYAAIRITPVVAKYTMKALESSASRKVAAAGAKAAADAFSNNHGIANYSTINVAFNGAKGLWE